MKKIWELPFWQHWVNLTAIWQLFYSAGHFSNEYRAFEIRLFNSIIPLFFFFKYNFRHSLILWHSTGPNGGQLLLWCGKAVLSSHFILRCPAMIKDKKLLFWKNCILKVYVCVRMCVVGLIAKLLNDYGNVCHFIVCCRSCGAGNVRKMLTEVEKFPFVLC